jgi:hypothetical protein
MSAQHSVVIAVLLAGAIFFAGMLILIGLVSREKPPAPVYPMRPNRLQRLWTLVLKCSKFVARKARLWTPVLVHVSKDCNASLSKAVLERVARERLPQITPPPFPAERIWRFARCHRPLTAAGHLVVVSDYPDGKSRAVLRPRSRPSVRVVLGELDTGPASDLEFLRQAKAHRVS